MDSEQRNSLKSAVSRSSSKSLNHSQSVQEPKSANLLNVNGKKQKSLYQTLIKRHHTEHPMPFARLTKEPSKKGETFK